MGSRSDEKGRSIYLSMLQFSSQAAEGSPNYKHHVISALLMIFLQFCGDSDQLHHLSFAQISPFPKSLVNSLKT